MHNVKTTIFLLLYIITTLGQNIVADSLKNTPKISFKYEALIIPSILLGYGIVSLESHSLKQINTNTKDEIMEHIDKKISIDDFSQYSPFLAVYGLNAAGIRGKNNFKNRTLILATAYTIVGGTINILKATGNVQRPDGSSNNSFPSGHTATAFMGAEFMYQEYKDVSIWYGISGYLVAAGTGYFRMYNNRHWLSDVAAGAGIGILSTKIAYLTHPFLKRIIFKEKSSANGMLMPFYNGREYGMSAILKY